MLLPTCGLACCAPTLTSPHVFISCLMHIHALSLQADVERDFAAETFGLKTFPTLVLLPKGGKNGACLPGGSGGGVSALLQPVLSPALQHQRKKSSSLHLSPPDMCSCHPAHHPAGTFVKYPSERRDAETLGMWVRTLTGTQ